MRANLLYTKYCYSKKAITSLKYFSDLTEPQIFKVDFIFFFMSEINLSFIKMKSLYSYIRTEFWKIISKDWSTSNIKKLSNSKNKRWGTHQHVQLHTRDQDNTVVIMSKILQKINYVSGKTHTLTLYMASSQLTGHENWTLQFTEILCDIESCPCFSVVSKGIFSSSFFHV